MTSKFLADPAEVNGTIIAPYSSTCDVAYQSQTVPYTRRSMEYEDYDSKIFSSLSQATITASIMLKLATTRSFGSGTMSILTTN